MASPSDHVHGLDDNVVDTDNVVDEAITEDKLDAAVRAKIGTIKTLVEFINDENKALGASDVGKVFSVNAGATDKTVSVPDESENGDSFIIQKGR